MKLKNWRRNFKYKFVDQFKQLPKSVEIEIPVYTITETESLLKQKFFESNTAYADVEDSKWFNSLAKSEQLYYHWLDKLPIMVALKMVLTAISGVAPGSVNLATRSVRFGAYSLDRQTNAYQGPVDIGAVAKFINSEYNLDCEYGSVSLERLKYEMAAKHYVISEVKSGIRYVGKSLNVPTSELEAPESGGKSWVVGCGYSLAKKNIRFHNPTGIYKYSVRNVAIADKLFKQYYTGRSLIIKGKSVVS